MNESDILHLRLANQQIAGTKLESPRDLVRWLGAIQAQDFRSALWSVGLRLPGSTSADIDRAIRNRQIVRAWALRGTIHLVAAEDVRWLATLTGPRAASKSARACRQAGLTDADLRKAFTLLEKGLRQEGELTRQQIGSIWESAGVATDNQRGYLMLSRAGHEGRICFGPMKDKQQTFVLLNEWVRKEAAFTREESLTELATRYFTSHGPATVDDFAWWCGCTLTDVRRAIGRIMPRLSSTNAAGRDYLYVAKRGPILPKRTVYLLPGFDEYMLGYTDRSFLIAAAHRHHIYPANAVYPGVIISDGRIKGIWRSDSRRTGKVDALSLFTTLSYRVGREMRMAYAAHNQFWTSHGTAY